MLEFDAVSYRYPGAEHATVASVSFTVARGETVALVGPNGSGKTTLVRLASGLLRPGGGSVRIAGVEPTALGPRERARQVAWVPQALEALPPVTVGTFVAAGRYPWIDRWRGPTARDRTAVEAALERTGIVAWRDRILRTLSGGELQRALVARALAQDTPLLLCDEPTTSLDVEHQIRVLELCTARPGDDRAVLIVTHDLNLAAQFADRIVVLAGGRVTASGTPADVLSAEVLVPVWGDGLHVGRLADGSPVVVPRRRTP